jgi:hypothetical protein
MVSTAFTPTYLNLNLTLTTWIVVLAEFNLNLDSMFDGIKTDFQPTSYKHQMG